MDPAAPIEVLYPQTKKDYEEYVNRVVKELKRHEESEAARKREAAQKAGEAAPAAGKEGNQWYMALLGELFAKALEETDPDDIRTYATRLDEAVNKKLADIAKEQGRRKVVKGGAMRMDGDGDYGALEHEDEGAGGAGDEKELEEAAERDRKAAEAQARKQLEAKQLQEKLMVDRKPPREVDTSQFQGGKMLNLNRKKDGDDDMFGFGGGKKKGKKK
eukprot:TRINITY_DN4671_c0_g1_i1.p2 TRINITY_DN4671_c0_g1~~TRINITY_DN4671_c0_g1_i1.p2  ORF type:complete len:217 (+),score=115.38 TRINITY_DN4671_c0_g1_i1:149-799(+)